MKWFCGQCMRISQPQLLTIVDLRPTRVLVKLTAPVVLVGSNETVVNWDSEPYDTAGWHDNAVNNTRLTVPPGVSLARFSFVLDVSAAGNGGVRAFLLQNGVTIPGVAGARNTVDTAPDLVFLGAQSAILPVVPGDVFELSILNESGFNASLLSGNATWFAAEGWA